MEAELEGEKTAFRTFLGVFAYRKKKGFFFLSFHVLLK